MAFCTNCGANVTGGFCQQCGQPAAGAAAPPPVYQPPAGFPPPPGSAPARRKTSPIVWILIILLGLVVLAGIGMVGAGFFVYRTAQRAGFDPREMQRNPGVAVTKMLTALNPDLEVIKVNEGKGTITVREKSSGKIVSLNFDDIKQGRIVIGDETEGKTASIDIGASASKVPSWVPSYPGAKLEGTFSINSGEGQFASYSFKTSDAQEKVIEFYRDALTGAGFKITTTASTAESNMLSAEDEASGRNVVVTASKGTVAVMFGVKKPE